MSEENTILYLEKWCYFMALCWAPQPKNLGPLTIGMIIRYLWTRPKQWKLKCNLLNEIEWKLLILVKCYKSARYWAIQPYLMLKTIFLKSHDPDLSTRIGQKYPNHLQEILEFSKLLILGELKNMSLAGGGKIGVFGQNIYPWRQSVSMNFLKVSVSNLPFSPI